MFINILINGILIIIVIQIINLLLISIANAMQA